LANRDLTRPVFLGKTGPNPWLNRMVAAMVVTLVAVMGIPWLQQVMGTVWPGGTGLAAGAVLLGLCGSWLELLRRASSISGAH
jgi:Ca2+-transporting ATPase